MGTKAKRSTERIELRSVFLTDDQVKLADRLAHSKEWSRAKLCRKAIELVLSRPDLIAA